MPETRTILDCPPPTPPPSSPLLIKDNNNNNNRLINHGSKAKKQSSSITTSKSKPSKSVKFWSLSTISSGRFNPLRLTERQQLSYVAAKSAGRVENDLLASPFRLDRLMATTITTAEMAAQKRPSILKERPPVVMAEMKNHQNAEFEMKIQEIPTVDVTNDQITEFLVAPPVAAFLEAYRQIQRDRASRLREERKE